MPKSYRVKKYPLVEHGLWLFIWPGDPDKADPALLPPLDEIGFTNPDFRFQPFYSLEVEGRYQLLNDNLLDLTHLAYLHGSSIGVEGNASAPEEREESDYVLKSRRHMKNVPIMAAQAGTFGYDGPVNRVSGMNFYLPGFHAGLDEMTIPDDAPERAGEKLTVHRVVHAVTPAKRDSCNYFFAMGGILTDEEFAHTKRYLEPVIEEDAMATREIEQMLQTLGYFPDEYMLKSDTGAVQARRKLQAMMDAENA